MQRIAVLQTAQIFGVLPVGGVLAANVRDVKFRWMRPNVLLAAFVLMGASVETGLSIYRGLKVGMDMDVAGSFITHDTENTLNGVNVIVGISLCS